MENPIYINEESIICPITQMILLEPVLMSDGKFYEKCALNSWLTTNRTSPLTREDISKMPIVISIDYKLLIDNYLQINPHRKKDQYVKSILHVDNINDINNIIKNQSFEKLLEFREFDLQIIMDNKLFVGLCESAQNNVLIHIIKNAISLECKNINDTTVAMIIIKRCDIDVIKSLFDKGFNLNSADKFGFTAIFYANNNIKENLFKLLIDNGSDIHANSKYGCLLADLFDRNEVLSEMQFNEVMYLISRYDKIKYNQSLLELVLKSLIIDEYIIRIMYALSEKMLNN